MGSQRKPLLLVRELHTDFIHDVNLALSAHSCLGLHGESGSGKTLLLRAIADLDVNEGDVRLDDRPRELFTGPQWRRQVSLLPAESQWWSDSVGGHASHRPSELLSALGFPEDVLSWQTGRLSSGEKQRLSLVRMLSNQPRVLLLDEPTANLDAGNTDIVEQIINDYLRQHQAAAIWVSHDPAQLTRIADSRAIMDQGRFLPEEN
ncbi:ABC transporter ATP-binding protein [Thiolapillus sp.]|nr:ABC transporter ATP-binding protein [Thiolapillus sp.]